jgi:hypothetical protein
MPKPKTKCVDPACVELAEHFLADCEGADETDVRELAELFQMAAEDYCRDFDEEDDPAADPEPA